MFNFLIGLIFIFMGGLFTLLFKEESKAKVFNIFMFLGVSSIFWTAITVLLSGKVVDTTFCLPEPIGCIPLVIDSLSAFFVLVISVMSLIGCGYASGYLKPYLNKNNSISSHFIFLSILICSMLGVVVVQNVLFFLIIWEIMSLSSFFLVIFENQKKEVLSAGINYLVYMHVSVVFIILGLVLLSIKAGSFNFSAFSEVLNSDIVFANLAFVLLFVGFGIKAGFVPFHNWLPKAHPAAPSHVSGIMSGVMIKTGIYGVLRVLTFVSIPSVEIAYFVLIISVISALYGVLYAISQHDLKRLLAYHSIENIGIIGIGIGVGMLGLAYDNVLVSTLGFAGGVLHILNHSIFKELLFLAAGAVYKQTHTKNIEKFGGLIKSMPITGGLFLIASVAIVGLPPLNGFVSEVLIYLGMFKGLEIENIYSLVILIFAIGALALVGTMALLCFSKAFSVVFLGLPRSDEAKLVQNDVEQNMILPMSILAIFIFLIGLFPEYAIKIVLNPVKVFLGSSFVLNDISYPVSILGIISKAYMAFFGVVLGLLLIRKILIKNVETTVQDTWGCGYKEGNNRMQYTASSFASPFLSMMSPFFVKKFDFKKPKGLFPKSAEFELIIEDIEEFYLIKPMIKNINKFLSKFQWIQNGNIQQYILYGLLFLLLVLFGMIYFG